MTVAAHEERKERTAERVELIALDLIDPAPDNPRRELGDGAELTQSILALGLINPLVVTPRGDRYLLVCGHRRYAGCVDAGLDAVSCVIREFSEAERQEAMLIENVQRTDLSVLEEATSYRRLIELGQTQRQLAERIGRSQGHISKRLALLELPEELQAEVDSGGITLDDAQEIGKLKAHPKRLKEVVADVKRQGITYARYSIERHLADVEREKKVAKITADLEAKGETVVRVEYRYQPPLGHAFVVPGFSVYGDSIDMKAADHAKLKCHVAGVDTHGNLVELCNDVGQHPKPKQQQGAVSAGMTKADKAAAKRREDLAREAERRRSFVGQLVAGKVTKDDALALAVDGIFSFDQWTAWELAARWLEVELPSEPGDEPIIEPEVAAAATDAYSGQDAETLELAIRQRARRSEADRLRVILALAAGTIEERVDNTYHGWDSDILDVAGYFGWLASKGYAISKPEQKQLDAVTKAARP